jgi:hypothetical protein
VTRNTGDRQGSEQGKEDVDAWSYLSLAMKEFLFWEMRNDVRK